MNRFNGTIWSKPQPNTPRPLARKEKGEMTAICLKLAARKAEIREEQRKR